jgi:hypothetical protein
MQLKRIYREAMFVRFDMAYEAGEEERDLKKELFFYPTSGMNSKKADVYEEHGLGNKADRFHINECMEEFRIRSKRYQREQYW